MEWLTWLGHSAIFKSFGAALFPIIGADLIALFKAPEIAENGWARFAHWDWKVATFAYARGIVLWAVGYFGLTLVM